MEFEATFERIAARQLERRKARIAAILDKPRKTHCRRGHEKIRANGSFRPGGYFCCYKCHKYVRDRKKALAKGEPRMDDGFVLKTRWTGGGGS